MQLTREERQHTIRATAALHIPLAPEDQARADLYALVARLFLTPPDAALLSDLANADSLRSEQTGNPFELAWEKLMLSAGIMEACAIEQEFNQLFISAGSPQINPYASLYLAGFMHEKPLAALRGELAELGLARVPGVGETEDHLAALCETMRLLISGGQGARRQSVRRQKLFFEKHIAPWYGRCLEDIRRAEGVSFYRHVADFTQAFFSIESEAFEMEEAGEADYR